MILIINTLFSLFSCKYVLLESIFQTINSTDINLKKSYITRWCMAERRKTYETTYECGHEYGHS